MLEILFFTFEPPPKTSDMLMVFDALYIANDTRKTLALLSTHLSVPGTNEVAYLQDDGSGITITSLSYPANYPIREETNWQFLAPSDRAIVVVFNDFALENGTPDDSLRILTGNRSEDRYQNQIGFFTELTMPGDFVSYFPRLWIEFSSDEADVNRGFNATVFAVNASGKQ